MNILFTGGSSFTGMWFVKELASAGHHIKAPLLQSKDSYKEIRAERVKHLIRNADVIDECPFGSEAFEKVIESEDRWDILCHHAADVTDYKSPSFNYLKAAENNTHRLPKVLAALKERGCKRVVITGSVFEQGEGAGSDDLRAVSPYGLSKGITSDIFRYWCSLFEMRLGKFVIPNPFGPYEEERFTAFLMNTWFSGDTAKVSHPDYVRDNIHVTLLAKVYTQFVSKLSSSPGFEKINPSQYVGSQGDFAKLFAEEMRLRLDYLCNIEMLQQKDFSEPMERYNTDKIIPEKFGWDEKNAWDEVARYYLNAKP